MFSIKSPQPVEILMCVLLIWVMRKWNWFEVSFFARYNIFNFYNKYSLLNEEIWRRYLFTSTWFFSIQPSSCMYQSDFILALTRLSSVAACLYASMSVVVLTKLFICQHFYSFSYKIVCLPAACQLNFQ